MKTQLPPYKILNSIIAVLAVISLTACGTSQHVTQDDYDGIYNSTTSTSQTDEVYSQQQDTVQDDIEGRNYYKQYFQSRAKVYEKEPEDDVIFTDVEGYTSSNAYIDAEGYIVEEDIHYSETEAYGGWGDDAQVSINIYSNPGFGFYNPWMFYHPYPYWGWHRPHWWYGSGWGVSVWYGGWGWAHPIYGYGYYGGYGYPVYGYGHPYHFYGGYGGSNYHNNVAINRGRRNLDYNARARSTNQRMQGRGESSYSRSELNRRINTSRTAQQARRTTTQSRTNQDSRRAPIQRGNPNIRTSPNTRNSPNTNRNRNVTPQQRGNNRNISTPPPSRSSGSMNRGGSVRSSGGGGTRSSGGGGSRRGG